MNILERPRVPRCHGNAIPIFTFMRVVIPKPMRRRHASGLTACRLGVLARCKKFLDPPSVYRLEEGVVEFTEEI
jgi:hypothetical protein